MMILVINKAKEIGCWFVRGLCTLQVLRISPVLSLFLYGVMLLGQDAIGRTLYVDGWYRLTELKLDGIPDDRLGDDPVIGRLACPSLLRFNPSIGKMEPVLLRSLPETSENGTTYWRFSLRTGLRWWGGDPVGSDAVVSWLNRELQSYKNKNSVDPWPKFKVQVTNVGIIEIEWASKPKFGPYFLAGRSLWRSHTTSKLGYECAGLYQISSVVASKKVDLAIAKGYSSKWENISINAGLEGTSKTPSLRFVSSGSASWNAAISPGQSCKTHLDVPFLSAIVWNPQSANAQFPSVRQAFTHAMPRGEILRIAAGDLGSLISAPILRSHPGYDAKTLVRPFNLEIASKKLDEAGFRQESIGVPRIGQQGQPMNIRIGSNGRGQHLAEKMIRDAFASLGIKTEFIPIGQDGKNMAPEDLDGVFTGVEMPWPELDYESTLHSEQEAISGRFPFYRWNDKPLDEYLSGYHRSLLEGKPRFDLIQRIHQRWAELEPWTILLGHQVCVESLDVPVKTAISIADPDWFRRIVLD